MLNETRRGETQADLINALEGSPVHLLAMRMLTIQKRAEELETLVNRLVDGTLGLGPHKESGLVRAHIENPFDGGDFGLLFAMQRDADEALHRAIINCGKLIYPPEEFEKVKAASQMQRYAEQREGAAIDVPRRTH